MSVLDRIVERTKATVARRERRFKAQLHDAAEGLDSRPRSVDALRRIAGSPIRVIAEIKYRSPSAGEIRPWRPADAIEVATGYARGGAAAVSVLADGPGFGGSPLTVRRVCEAVHVPVLYKGFVVSESQLDLAKVVGASFVLLLVRGLSADALSRLVKATLARGLQPLVEAADEHELRQALQTDAQLIGVNARDLRTFQVDTDAARLLLEAIPRERVAVYMSGIRSADDLAAVSAGRADAALIGEGLMRTTSPGDTLRAWLGASPTQHNK